MGLATTVGEGEVLGVATEVVGVREDSTQRVYVVLERICVGITHTAGELLWSGLL